MSATPRTGLLNSFLQSDLYGRSDQERIDDVPPRFIRDISGVEAIANLVLYVDPSAAFEYGEVGTTLPFKTISAALAVAPAGSLVIMRPGDYPIDGQLSIPRNRIRVLGYGARIISVTATDPSKLLISGSNVSVEGLEFDGQGAIDVADQLTRGVIEVQNAANVNLRNLSIHNWGPVGIRLIDRYDGVKIDNCQINACGIGVTADIGTTSDIFGLDIINSPMQGNRDGAIMLRGNSDTKLLREVRVSGCNLVNNEAQGRLKSSIEVKSGVRDVRTLGNFVYGTHQGIRYDHVKRGTIADNVIQGCATFGIELSGCQAISVNGGIIDGAAIGGANVGGKGISILGYYTTLYDAGPYVISGTNVRNITTVFLDEDDVTDLTIADVNWIGAGVIQLTDYSGVTISGGVIKTSNGSALGLIQSSTLARGINKLKVFGVRFVPTGTPGRLISFSDAGGFGQDDVQIVGNNSPIGGHYNSGSVSLASGALTNYQIRANNPPTATRAAGIPDARDGWINDEQLAITTDLVNLPGDVSGDGYQVAGLRVVGPRKTGWANPTGTLARTTFDQSTVTLPELAKRVAALITDLSSITAANAGHGLIGT